MIKEKCRPKRKYIDDVKKWVYMILLLEVDEWGSLIVSNDEEYILWSVMLCYDSSYDFRLGIKVK